MIRVVARRVLAPALVVVALFASETHAQDARSALERARSADAAHDHALAAREYARAIELAPHARTSHVARRRLAWMNARAEGAYVPLGVLERARADATLDLSRFERAVHAMPRGRVRRESWELLASRYRTAGRPEDAERALRAWLDEPALLSDERARATAALARVVARDEPWAAQTILEEAGMADADVARELAFVRRHALGRTIAFALLGLSALLVLVAAGARWAALSNLRALAKPQVVLLAVWITLVPLALAVRYDPSTQDTFVRLAVALGGLFLLAQLVAASLAERARWRRVTAACALLMAHGAVGYLVLLASGATLGVLSP